MPQSFICFTDKERTEKWLKVEETKDQTGTSVNKRFHFNIRHMAVSFASKEEKELSDH